MELRCAGFAVVLLAFSSLLLTRCGPRPTDLPTNAPLVGAPKLASSVPEIRPTYSVILPLCNRGPGDLKGQVQVDGDKKEAFSSLSGFGAPAGSYFYITVCEVLKKRLHPVKIRVAWQRGSSSGTEDFVVGPKEDDKVLSTR